MTAPSQICDFFENKNVFITGGTGFMGKVLIEKLLRSTDVATLFLLIREKKGKNVHSRLDDIFDNTIFQELKHERPKYRHRVIAISGDCSLGGLGLSITDRKRLSEEVHVVFHVAATVRFDENLKTAYSINVRGTGDLLELCKHMKNLTAVVHVSTAYSNCHLDAIDEKVYDSKTLFGYEKLGNLLEKMSKNEAEKITERIINPWPNTYTFTKALAECLIKESAGNLPIGIFRPSIVISTYKEPIEAWIDNFYGPTGAVAGAATGLLRVFNCNDDFIADMVPVDTCVAGVIASAWDIANQQKTKIPIYNYVSSVENPITWHEFNFLNKVHGNKYPLQKAIWTIKATRVQNRTLYVVLRMLLHLIPALLLDLFAIVTGNRPRLLSMYTKIHKFSDVITFFCMRQWKFRNENVVALWERMNDTDRILFPLSMKLVPWLSYFRNYFKGIRVFLIGDPLDTLEEARRRKWTFDLIHNGIILLAIYLIVVFFQNIVLGICEFVF